MGVESTSPCTRVKHLADLLRNKENSQQYPSVYEDRRPKSIEDTEKTDSKGLLQDNKVPGTSAGTRVTTATGPVPPRPATGLPCQTRFEQHQERSGCLKSQGGE